MKKSVGLEDGRKKCLAWAEIEVRLAWRLNKEMSQESVNPVCSVFLGEAESSPLRFESRCGLDSLAYHGYSGRELRRFGEEVWSSLTGRYLISRMVRYQYRVLENRY